MSWRIKTAVKMLMAASSLIANWPRMQPIRARNMAEGGLPIPGDFLMYLVAGSNDVPKFLKLGALAAQSIREILEKNKLKIEQFRSILDFGCGAGRVIRHWSSLNGPALYGTDYNPSLVQWCKRNLRFANFQSNALVGRLDYADQQFDLIYVLSVFTHLTEPQQHFWTEELARVLQPGGYLLITTHGDHYIPNIPTKDRQRFINGEMLVYGADAAGRNLCRAFHPKKFVYERLGKGWKVVDFIPEGAKGNPKQDMYLLQKP